MGVRKNSTPIVLTFSNNGFRCIITRQGRIKDCLFLGVKEWFISLTPNLLPINQLLGKK